VEVRPGALLGWHSAKSWASSQAWIVVIAAAAAAAVETGATFLKSAILGLQARAGSRWTAASTLLSHPLAVKAAAYKDNGGFAEAHARSAL